MLNLSAFGKQSGNTTATTTPNLNLSAFGIKPAVSSATTTSPDYAGTMGALPIAPSFAMKTSTQAIPDATTGEGVLGLAKGLTQGIARIPADFSVTAGQAGLSIYDKINGTTYTQKSVDTGAPTGSLSWLLGKEPVKGYASEILDFSQAIKESPLAQKYGLDKVSLPLAFGTVVPLEALNFFGGEEKGATAFMNTARKIPNTMEGVADMYKVARGAGFADDIARQYAPLWAKETTAKGIQDITDAAIKLQNTTKIAEEIPKIYTPIAERTAVPPPEALGRPTIASPFQTHLLQPLNTEQQAILPKVESVLNGASKTEVIAHVPSFVSADTKERPLIFSSEIANKIQMKHGSIFPENLVLNANDWDAAMKNVKSIEANGKMGAPNPDKINLLKVIPNSDNMLVIGANRDNGFYMVTHHEIVPKSGNEIKSILGRGDLVLPSGESISSADFLKVKGLPVREDLLPSSGPVPSSPEVLSAGSPSPTEAGGLDGLGIGTAKKSIANDAGKINDAELASLDRLAQQAHDLGLPELPRRSVGSLEGDVQATKKALEEAKFQRDMTKEVFPEETATGKQLQRFQSKREGEFLDMQDPNKAKTLAERERILARNNKIEDTVRFGSAKDYSEENLNMSDAARVAIADYKRAKTQLDAAELSVSKRVKDYRDRKAVFDEVVRYVKQEGQARRDKVKIVQDFFKLSNEEMKGIMKGERDVRLMNDGEFEDFMKRIEGKSTEAYLKMQDLVDLKATIFEKEFVKLDNLRKAMQLPRIENMTPTQMREFNATLQEFKVGDEFLGVRQLQTVKNTDLAGIHTMREARERLLIDVNKLRASKGLPPATIEDLKNVNVGTLDKFRYDVALARQNPLYDLMVNETHRSILNADAVVLEVKDKVNELFKAARASRPRSLLERLIPTDKRIFQWLEAPDAQKIVLANDMTKEELDAAMYVRAWYAEARDYLIQQQTLKRYISDYITHIRRGFLEGWLEESRKLKIPVSGENAPGVIERTGKGLLAAFKEVLATYKQDEAVFNIMNEKTGDVLPLEKFFQFSLKRTGELVPTQNAASAFLKYVATFEKKKALDGLIPKLDIYVHSLTPKKLTPRGLEFDDSLKRLFKTWMNTKKGRVVDLYLISPGGKIDWAMRTGVALTRIIDLGLAVPVGIASNLGAQSAVFIGLGAKGYATGVARLASKDGRIFVSQYKNLVGETVIEKIRAADATLGDNLMTGVFGLFSFADRKARQEFLLGSLTKAEFASGKISPERLTEIQQKLGRYLPVENMTSIAGKTAPGKVFMQYKSWAEPLLLTTLSDIAKFSTAVRGGNFSAFVHSQEGAELLRTIVLSSAVGLGAYGVLTDKTPMKDMSFTEKIAMKAAQDALSSISALDPAFWLGEPRLMKFMGDLGTAVHQIVVIQKNKNGDLTGVNTLERTLTPGVIRQFISPSISDGGTSGIKIPSIQIPSIKTPSVNIPRISI